MRGVSLWRHQPAQSDSARSLAAPTGELTKKPFSKGREKLREQFSLGAEGVGGRGLHAQICEFQTLLPLGFQPGH